MHTITQFLIIAVFMVLAPLAQAEEQPDVFALDHTFSIVALDPATGELGVAVQTHAFGVGVRVPHAEPGVGAVATQSFTNPSYGPLGLDLMRAGKTAPEALTALLAADEGRAVRQVGMVDADGNVANHTGARAIDAHCKITGENYAIQANLMERDTVCTAMAEAFEGTEGNLAARLMAALYAGQGEGGDIRGMQSAAMKVVSGDATTPPWDGIEYDLRVDDHVAPLDELSRLLTIANAGKVRNRANAALSAGDFDRAMHLFAEATAMTPEAHEPIFWQGVALLNAGYVDEAMPAFQKAFAMWPLWRETLTRLPKSGLFPEDEALIGRILALE